MTDWYIDQMKTKTYESDPLPISFTHDQYVGDKLDYVAHIPKVESRWDIRFDCFYQKSKINSRHAKWSNLHFTQQIRSEFC
jgi:hypothetical protein